MQRTYKHKPISLIAKEEGCRCLMRSWVFGKKLVSVPFALYGGVCADNETVETALWGKAYMLQRLNAKYAAYIHGPAHEFPERSQKR